MWRMVQDAWAGWINFTDSGKMAALAIVALLYLWLAFRCKGPQKRLMIYGAITVTLCICPATAAVLMYYQTRFYNYQWIWSMVPLTALIAFAGTLF